jgi:hypothetical protein
VGKNTRVDVGLTSTIEAIKEFCKITSTLRYKSAVLENCDTLESAGIPFGATLRTKPRSTPGGFGSRAQYEAHRRLRANESQVSRKYKDLNEKQTVEINDHTTAVGDKTCEKVEQVLKLIQANSETLDALHGKLFASDATKKYQAQN